MQPTSVAKKPALKWKDPVWWWRGKRAYAAIYTGRAVKRFCIQTPHTLKRGSRYNQRSYSYVKPENLSRRFTSELEHTVFEALYGPERQPDGAF